MGGIFYFCKRIGLTLFADVKKNFCAPNPPRRPATKTHGSFSLDRAVDMPTVRKKRSVSDWRTTTLFREWGAGVHILKTATIMPYHLSQTSFSLDARKCRLFSTTCSLSSGVKGSDIDKYKLYLTMSSTIF